MDALIFPSRLETWGLPISEAKAMQKPLWVADVPYAHETVGTYENVVFFNPNNPQQLADTLRQWLQGKAVYTGNQAVQGEGLVLENWTAMFDFICSAHAKV
jgi:glycosyltransferase involved in cell wall biosynthesis